MTEDLENGLSPAPLEPEPRAVILLTAAEVAEILGLKSARTVYKLAARHRWTFQRALGKEKKCRVRYERRGLLQWIKRRPTHWKREGIDSVYASLHNGALKGGAHNA